jgi:hypothetical protein
LTVFTISFPIVAERASNEDKTPVPRRIAMRPLMNVKHRDNRYFHPHPLQSTFGLIASMALAGLMAVAILLALAH